MKTLCIALFVCSSAVAAAQALYDSKFGIEVAFPKSEKWESVERIKFGPRTEIWRQQQKAGKRTLDVKLSIYAGDQKVPTLEEVRDAFRTSRGFIRSEDVTVGGHRACKIVLGPGPSDPPFRIVLIIVIIRNHRYEFSRSDTSLDVEEDLDFLAFLESVKFTAERPNQSTQPTSGLAPGRG